MFFEFFDVRFLHNTSIMIKTTTTATAGTMHPTLKVDEIVQQMKTQLIHRD